MDRRHWGLLLLLGAIWGASYLFISIGLRDLSPAMVSWIRIVLAALVLVPFALSRGALAGIGALVVWIAVLAAVQVAGPFVLIAAGQQDIPSAFAGILVASAPLFTALLAPALDPTERSTGLRLVGVLTGFAGVALLLGVDLGGESAMLLGGLLVVLAALGYAIGGFILKRRLSGRAPVGVSAAVMVASAVMLAPPAIASAPAELPGAGPLLAVATLGVIGTGVAFGIFYSLISAVGASRAFLVTYIAPAFAVVYGGVLLDEPITGVTLSGLALILAGSWLAAEGRWPWRPRPAAGDPLPVPAEAPNA